jgi:hypothetical protein
MFNLHEKPDLTNVSGWGFQPMSYGQQRSGGGDDSFDWRGYSDHRNQERRAATPLGNSLIGDAAQGYGGAVGGAMGSLGAGLNANADRQAAGRGATMSYTNSRGYVPMDLDPGKFNEWMNNQARFDNAQHERSKRYAMDGMGMQQMQFDQQRNQQNAKAGDRMTYQLPYQQNLLSSMFSGMNGMMGGGSVPQLPTQFNTNYGARGSFGGAMADPRSLSGAF